MLDGRIDVQGSPKELRTQGVLDNIAHDSSLRAKEEEATAAPALADPETRAMEGDSTGSSPAAKNPRKLIKEEHRETGAVKWSIYKTYLKAS